MRCFPTCRDRSRKAGLRDHAEWAAGIKGVSRGVLNVSPDTFSLVGPGFVAKRVAFLLKEGDCEAREYIRLSRRKMPSAGYALSFQKVLMQMAWKVASGWKT